MVPMRDAGIMEALHEPESGLPSIQRLTQTRFMAPTHVQILDVLALHEPPPHPIPLPLGGGEGARRAGEGVVHGPNACEKRKGAFHEPPLSRPSATLSPPCGERAGRGVPIWFMAPMRAQKRKEALHEAQWRAFFGIRARRSNRGQPGRPFSLGFFKAMPNGRIESSQTGRVPRCGW